MVSVVMNCRNGEKYMRAAIDSVYAQTHRDWELIFFDNASGDASADIARSFGDRIRYFHSATPLTLGAARNLALKEAKGEQVAFLDSDDIWLPDKLKEQMELFSDREVGLVFCDAIYFNDAGMRRRLYSHRPYATGQCFGMLIQDYFLCMSTVIIRRQCLDGEAVWFDDRFELVEDGDLFTRIAHGWELDMAPQALVEYRVHFESSSWRRREAWADEKMLMIDGFRNRYPGFDLKFGKELRVLNQTLSIEKAMFHFQSGKTDAARRCLWPHIPFNVRALVLYLLALLPWDLGNTLIRWLRRGIVPS